MVTKFEFTHTRPVNSSAVDKVHYNEQTRELAVNLHGDVYRYGNVSLAEYERMIAPGASVGRHFQGIKRSHGPSTYLGRERDVLTEKVGGAPWGRQSGLVTTPQTRITTTPTRVTLGAVKPESKATRRHTVVFESGGRTHTHRLDVASVDEAVSAMSDLGSAVGVTLKVKEVVVSFE